MTEAALATSDGPAPILDPEDVPSLQQRWAELQQGFVDDPRSAVTGAEQLVSDVFQRITANFEADRLLLERVWHRGEEPSTEDLRVALQRYRGFFERLLTI